MVLFPEGVCRNDWLCAASNLLQRIARRSVAVVRGNNGITVAAEHVLFTIRPGMWKKLRRRNSLTLASDGTEGNGRGAAQPGGDTQPLS